MEQPVAPSVYAYLSFREFLRDFLGQAKEHRRGLTHRAVLEKMGVTSSGFLANVLSGKNNLTQSQARTLGDILGLKAAEFRYFLTLVDFTQARNIDEKGDALDSLRAQSRARNKKLDPRQYSLFSKWINPLIFELTALMPVGENYREISNMLEGAVKPEDVHKALEVLESLNLIRKNELGQYVQMHVSLKTGDEIVSTDVVKYQQSILKKAIEALDNLKASERSITATTLPLSKPSLALAKEEARIFRDKLLQISEADKDADRVFLLSVNLFPGTKIITKGGA
jgi:uncharacterized protein (TIGR02147 family)